MAKDGKLKKNFSIVKNFLEKAIIYKSYQYSY